MAPYNDFVITLGTKTLTKWIWISLINLVTRDVFLVLDLSQFLLLPLEPQKITSASKVVKSDSKKIIALC